MKSPHVSGNTFKAGVVLVAAALLVGALSTASLGAVDPSATARAGGPDVREITVGKGMGYARLGMTRDKVEHKLKSLGKPQRVKDGKLYSLTYHYRYPQTNCDGGTLSVVFHGLSGGSPAVYMVTVEPCFTTDDAGVGVFNSKEKLLASYPVHCYHSNPDGSRDPNFDDTDNSECELHANGGYTYFSFASVQADPDQLIGAIAIASRKVD